MPLRASEPALSPAERRRHVASILARGVIRWRRCVKASGIVMLFLAIRRQQSGRERSIIHLPRRCSTSIRQTDSEHDRTVSRD